jgi:hypothetical protein
MRHVWEIGSAGYMNLSIAWVDLLQKFSVKSKHVFALVFCVRALLGGTVNLRVKEYGYNAVINSTCFYSSDTCVTVGQRRALLAAAGKTTAFRVTKTHIANLLFNNFIKILLSLTYLPVG